MVFVKILKVLSLTLAVALLLLGAGLVIGFVHELPKHDSDLLIGLAFFIFLCFSLGTILFRIGRMPDLSCKAVGRMMLISLSVLSLLVAAGLALGAFVDVSLEGRGARIFFLCTMVFLPAAIGYLLLRWAGNEQDTLLARQRWRIRLYRVGLAMTICFVVAVSFELPTTGRLIAAFLLVLIFVRVHRGWSGRRLRTPLGVTSYAEVFDSILQGTAYLVLRIIFALLTGGRWAGSFRGGGGSSGGGGASGKW